MRKIHQLLQTLVPETYTFLLPVFYCSERVTWPPRTQGRLRTYSLAGQLPPSHNYSKRIWIAIDPKSITTRSTTLREAAGRGCAILFQPLHQTLLQGEVPSPTLTTHTSNQSLPLGWVITNLTPFRAT